MSEKSLDSKNTYRLHGLWLSFDSFLYLDIILKSIEQYYLEIVFVVYGKLV